MQVTELDSQGLKKNLKIVVEAAQINEQIEKELRAAGERIKMPGFRPGYIPLKILQQRYGKTVKSDVLKQVINRASSDAIAQKSLRPVVTPQVNIDDYQEGGALTFTMSFDTFPNIPEIDYSKITLDRKTFDIEEKQIDEAAQRLAERNPKLSRKEGGKAQSGNVVTIDFKGMIDGVAFEGGTASDFRLELGSGQFIAGFEDQLTGVKEGEDRTVNVTFPADYPAEKLAGREASFAVTVKEIYGKETPPVDEELAKTHGFADVRALREAIRNQMLKEYEQVVRNQLKKQLFDELEAQFDFELPQGMVDLEFNTIWERLKQARDQGEEADAGQSDEELKEEYGQIARRRVKLGLVLAEIGNRNRIQISREEMTRAVVQQAGMFPGQEKQVMDYYRNNPERVEDLRGPILEEKAVDLILGKVAFNDHKVSLEELAEQNDSDDEGSADEKKKKPAKAKASKSAGEEARKKPARKKAANE